MSQSRFSAALLSPDAPMPEGLVDPQGRPAPARFDVYRNNVTASLLRVLQAAFPVVEKLVGPAFFAAMAVDFLRAQPPKTRMMMLYGADFPGFLTKFAPAASLPYLPDMARLEQAIRESYHAADAAPVARDRLSALAPEALLAARLVLAPSLRLIRSHWPILSIWHANRGGAAVGTFAPEAAVILRSDYDPAPFALSSGSAAILSNLLAGQPIGAALDAAETQSDFTDLLTLLLAHGAVKDIT